MQYQTDRYEILFNFLSFISLNLPNWIFSAAAQNCADSFVSTPILLKKGLPPKVAFTKSLCLGKNGTENNMPHEILQSLVSYIKTDNSFLKKMSEVGRLFSNMGLFQISFLQIENYLWAITIRVPLSSSSLLGKKFLQEIVLSMEHIPNKAVSLHLNGCVLCSLILSQWCIKTKEYISVDIDNALGLSTRASQV